MGVLAIVGAASRDAGRARRPGPSRRGAAAFWHHPMAIMGASGLAFLVLFSFAGPLVDRVDPMTVHILDTLSPPSPAHLLGTDALGRDELARLMVGGQTSLLVGFASALASMLIGVAYGLVAGYAGGAVDNVMMRIVDVLIAVPVLLYLLFLDAVFRPSPPLMIAIIAMSSWFGVSRLVRSEVLSLVERPFIEAARASGAGPGRIMVRHLLPNVMGTVLVASILQVVTAILYVATLSFLGLGLPAASPDWGGMLSGSMHDILRGTWWLIYPPGCAILWALLSVNFIGEALRGVFDARLQMRGA